MFNSSDKLCDDWRPDWKDSATIKYVIRAYECKEDTITKSASSCINAILSFPTKEIRDKFYDTYKDLIEEAKMFL